MTRDMPDERDGGSSHVRGRILFPTVGALAGLATFLSFYLLWPSARAANSTGVSDQAVQALTSGSGSAGSARTPGLRVTAGDGTASVSWPVPTGLHSAQYTVEAVPENSTLSAAQCTTTALSCAVSGLTDGATYTIEVRAVDSAGTTTALGQAQVTPYPAILTSSAAALWLNADDISGAQGAPVSLWPDASGRANSAAQSQQNAQPVLATLGGHQAVRFSGSQNLVIDGNRLPSGSQPSEIFAVAELQDANAASSCFAHVIAWGAGNTDQARIVDKGCHNQFVYAETFNTYSLMNPETTWPEGKAALVTADFTSSDLTVRVNGAADYTWPIPPNSTTATKTQAMAMVGGAPWWGDTDGWTGLIGEVVVLSDQVTTDQQQAVEQYLLRKWGIPT